MMIISITTSCQDLWSTSHHPSGRKFLIRLKVYLNSFSTLGVDIWADTRQLLGLDEDAAVATMACLTSQLIAGVIPSASQPPTAPPCPTAGP